MTRELVKRRMRMALQPHFGGLSYVRIPRQVVRRIAEQDRPRQAASLGHRAS